MTTGPGRPPALVWAATAATPALAGPVTARTGVDDTTVVDLTPRTSHDPITDDSTANDPTGNDPTGEDPTGDDPTGEDPIGPTLRPCR